MAFTLTSTAFAEGEELPTPYTCDGEGYSPELSWQGAPDGTRSFVLILHDPDSTRKPDFTHWVLLDIPRSADRLPRAEGDALGTPGGNDFGEAGYGGPCPAIGRHRYMFDLYALDRETLGLEIGASREEVDGAMEGHLLARARLTAHYQRPQASPGTKR